MTSNDSYFLIYSFSDIEAHYNIPLTKIPVYFISPCAQTPPSL